MTDVTVSVLMYHSIGVGPPANMRVAPSRFESQMRWLADSGLRIISLNDICGARQVVDVDQDAVLITLDDGYLNTVSTALPILECFNLPATVAVCGSYLNPMTRPNTTSHVECDFMSVRDLDKWLASGRDYMAHGYTHEDLTALRFDSLVYELDEDLETLSASTGVRPDAFAFPFGRRNEVVVQEVARRYSTSFAADSERELIPEERHELPRRQVSGSTTLTQFKNLIERRSYNARF